MADILRIKPPVSVRALSAALDMKVSEVLAILTFRVGPPGRTTRSQLTGQEVLALAKELGRRVELVDDESDEDSN